MTRMTIYEKKVRKMALAVNYANDSQNWLLGEVIPRKFTGRNTHQRAKHPVVV